MKQQNIRDMEGYDEMYLKAMPVAKRLDGIAPQDRLMGLDRDQQALALPLEVLRGLTEAYILSLAPETQEKLRQRMQSGDH